MGYYRKVDTATNLLIWSEEIDVGSGTAAWENNGNGLTVTQNATVAPDGATTAETLEQSTQPAVNRSMRQDYTARAVTYAGEWFTHSIWARKVSGNDATPTFKLNLISDGTPVERHSKGLDLSSEWKRFDYAVQCPSDASTYVTFAVEIGWSTAGAANDNVIAIWGAQAVRGRVAEPYIPTTTVAVTAAVRRDNHWHKDHNGIWRRTLLIEQTETNIAQYSAGPFKDNSFWNDPTGDYTSMENVVSCIEGGTALRAVSVVDKGVRIHSFGNFGTNSGGVEVMSGILERVNQTYSAIASWDGSWANYVQAKYDWSNKQLALEDTQGLHVDSGFENLGVGPNGGELVRIWIAFDTGHVDWSGNTRNIQWRVDTNFSGAETSILHYAGYSVYVGGTAEERSYPTSPIVTAGASATRNIEEFYIPTSLTPQLMTIYVRMKLGQLNETFERLISVGDASGAGDIYLDMYLHGNGTVVAGNVNDLDNAWWGATPTGGTAFVVGDTVEGRMVFDPSNDRFKAQSAVNGVADTESAWNTSINVSGGSFDTQNVWLGGWSADNDCMCGAFEVAKICTGDQTLEFMRGYKETGTREY